jgi:hypothetical protein
MATTPRWISFQLEDRLGGMKTDVWHVWSVRNPPAHLGVVKWAATWRRYAFFPGPQTLYEEECLRDLATFLVEQTAAHRKGKRAAPAGSLGG